jgi:hypothetical protein
MPVSRTRHHFTSEACRESEFLLTYGSGMRPSFVLLDLACVDCGASLQAPGHPSTRGSSFDSHPEHSEGSLFLSKLTPGLFREHGVVHLPEVTGTVFSVTLAACTYVLQCALDVLQDKVTEAGCLHQCQVDLLAMHGSVPMQQALPFYQDIIAACETACSSNGAVSLLDQPQLETLLSQRSITS